VSAPTNANLPDSLAKLRPIPSVAPVPQAARLDEGCGVATLLQVATKRGASDLILVADAPPTAYLNGRWTPLSSEPFDPTLLVDCARNLLSKPQAAQLETGKDLDLALELGGSGRYRVNLHYQRGSLAAAFRSIPTEIPSFQSLNLPPHVLRFADYPNGLVLVTGGAGQGKSTTLAALIDHMNAGRSAHVITLEDPIEFAFRHGTCLIEQREIGSDSPSFASALRHVLRQRPDVIVIGEVRDLETLSTALTAAETGHLVFASLHTSGAAQSLARIIDVFPAASQPQVRVQIAASLQAIICQTLLKDTLNGMLVPATEIMVATAAIRRAIRESETHLIYSMIETGKCHGMHTLEQSIAELVKAGRVAPDEALAATPEPGRLARLIGYVAPEEDARLAEIAIMKSAFNEAPLGAGRRS